MKHDTVVDFHHVCQRYVKVTVLPSRELVYSVVSLYGIIFVSNFVSIRIWGRLTGPERFTSEWSFKGWYWTVWRRLFVDDNVGFVQHIFFLVKTIVQSGVEKSNLPKFLLIPGPLLFPSPPPPQDPTTYPTTSRWFHSWSISSIFICLILFRDCLWTLCSSPTLNVWGTIFLEKMILLQQNKKRREPGKKCHARTMMHSKPIKLST
jgi:hypothetical protein